MGTSRQPLFQLDPGWLFIIAGILVCAAGILIPAQEDLRALRFQLEQLHAEEARVFDRLKAHSDFLDAVDQADPALVRRLAAAQLKMVPEGETPILLSSSQTIPITDWLDSSIGVHPPPRLDHEQSTLARFANGPKRLWLFALGAFSVFVGLLVSPREAMPAGTMHTRTLWPTATGERVTAPGATSAEQAELKGGLGEGLPIGG